MTYRDEFPNFNPADMPKLPEGFFDTSWHNDVCPSFASQELGLVVFIDYAKPEEREMKGLSRFMLSTCDETAYPLESVAASDDWAAILAAIETRRIELMQG